MGLLVEVFRWSLGDCTNGGVSSKHNKLCLINVDGPFEPSDDAPAARIICHPTVKEHCYIVPETLLRGGPAFMAGGNFAYTSDSRFHEAVYRLTGTKGSFAVSIHDRVEE